MTPHDDMPAAHRRAADRLARAARERVPCAPIRDLLDPGDVPGAYAVQRLLSDAATGEGRREVGAKIGLTSAAVQRQLAVDSPDSGVLFADMGRDGSVEMDPRELLQPRIEAEVAFVLGSSLEGADLGAGDVRDAVRHAVPALEIVDSRIAGWDISLVDTIADNASCGLYVLGEDPRPLAGLDLPALRMSMTADGDAASSGVGRDCLGDPLNALLWLARTAQRQGTPLQAGAVVLSGALGPMVPVTPGTTYEAGIEGLGRVRASFAD